MVRFICVSVAALSMVVPHFLAAQLHYDNIWLQSDRDDGLIIDFSSGSPVLSDQEIPAVMDGASASICDADGNLAFYTNGCRIYNSRHQLMENGEGINPGAIHDEYCDLSDPFPRGYPGSPQSTTILPLSAMDSMYLILHIRLSFNDDPEVPNNVVYSPLYYTLVDMGENGGNGQVVEKNVVVDSLLREPKFILNRHANGTDWWLVNPLLNSDEYAIYLIDESGVNFHHRQSIGLLDVPFSVTGDQLSFNPMGNQLLRFSYYQGLRLFDFDRTTGFLSNFRLVPFPQDDPTAIVFGGIAVSPSGQFAYVSVRKEIYQYDLWSDDIAGSQVLIAELIDDGAMLFPPTVEIMQLGPDCKIYAYMVNGNRHHVIHNPDGRGEECDFEQGGLLLGHYVFRDQPTFPNYRLGPVGDEGSICAGPIVSTVPSPDLRELSAKVYPNPAVREVSFSTAEADIVRVTLMDAVGRVVVVDRERVVRNEVGRLSLVGLRPGTYALRLRLEDGRLVVRKLVLR